MITGLLSLCRGPDPARPTAPDVDPGARRVDLIWFGFLTQMHERYAYGALIFLLLLIPERRIAWLYLGFSVVFTLDLLSAAPPPTIFAGMAAVRWDRLHHRRVRDDRDHVLNAYVDDVAGLGRGPLNRTIGSRSMRGLRRYSPPRDQRPHLVTNAGPTGSMRSWRSPLAWLSCSSSGSASVSRSRGPVDDHLRPGRHCRGPDAPVQRGSGRRSLSWSIGRRSSWSAWGLDVPYLAFLAIFTRRRDPGLCVVRRRTLPRVAVGITVIVLLFGSGFENLFWGAQIGFVGATAMARRAPPAR